jgi:hypothetical protein
MVLKLADLRKAFPDNWKATAAVTCMRRMWFAPTNRLHDL